jgi:type IV secretory pathway VirB3-like protein
MQHHVYTSLTKPIIWAGVPINILMVEACLVAAIFVVLEMTWFVFLMPFMHGAAVYLTIQDPNWHKVSMVKGRYFSKKRRFKERVRYNA